MTKASSSSAGVLREIRRVVSAEAAALESLRRTVSPAYAAAAEILFRCRGKAILTGVGKSGLVAQKIAATLTSTGTPAVYLDPAAAAHGSLGLVRKEDAVLAVGKSGESDELNAILPRLRQIGARLIALTSNSKSTLARAADLVVSLPDVEEACPLNLAPMSSTTVALAAGDALAAAVMKLRRFKTGDFALNHPAGRLGRRLALTAADVMRGGEDNPVVSAAETPENMLLEISRQRAGAVSVVDSKGRFLGLVTDYDVRQALQKKKNLFSLSIRRIMNSRPAVVTPETGAHKVVEIMENGGRPLSVLPVVDKRGRSVGMIQIHDLRARGL